ncbi:AAA family ATPase [Ensifer canadensis]|uniref:AAA family ATPase n=1 Tax=Ensifer canadensis TaxID=555315 RepID=UPI0035E3BFE9
MIKVDRFRVRLPFDSSVLHRFRDRANAYYELNPTARAQRRLDIDNEWRRIRSSVNDGLFELFHGKCAYCETSLAGGMDVDRFRPISGASDVDGSASVDHYAWLALDWENLYASCAACNRAKRSLFPVKGARAAPLTAYSSVVAQEQAMLIDPCNGEPEHHLAFSPDGSVRALSAEAEVTIRVLNLNRSALRHSRHLVYQSTTNLLSRNGDPAALVADETPYAAVARAAVQAHQEGPYPPSNFLSYAVPEEVRSADVVFATDEEAYRLAARPLRSVSVKNFKMLQEFDLEFPDVADKNAPWLMLLGINASGKSTLLQAVALALAGAAEANRILKPAQALTTGKSKGSITLNFWDSEQPVELHFSRNSQNFSGTQQPSAITLAYGALRHPGARRSGNGHQPLFVSVRSLFKAISYISHPARWLRDANEFQFGVAARALREILPIGDDVEIERRRGTIYFRVGSNALPLSSLSAGYRSVVAVVLDIIHLLLERWQALESATAIVLIDEIDAHLHPRWKMRIVKSLRDAFPFVQFITSTHDPLALRGLRNGEVALLRQDPMKGSVADRNLPPIEGMQVDQLLTSRHFGLESTLDPDTEALFDEYYYLLSQPKLPGAAQRIDELRSRLGDKESLGRNQRENLMLAAAASYLAEERALGLNASPCDLRQ